MARKKDKVDTSSVLFDVFYEDGSRASNRKVLEALQTAVSSKKPEWLEAVSTQVAQKHEDGDVSDAEFNAIRTIVKKAESGDWKGAQLASFALSEGQRPTAEDKELLKDRKRFQQPAKK